MKIDQTIQNQFNQIVNQMYKFEPYFNEILSKDFFSSRKLSIINEFPSLNNHIQKYRKAILAAKKIGYNEKKLLSVLTNESFTQEIGLSNTENSFYTVNWNIDELKQLIKKYHLKSQTVEIESVLNRLSSGSVPYIDESIPLKEDPIIVLDNPLISEIPKIIVADGNYRTVRKFMRGDKTIELYLIPPNIHLQGMMDKTSVISYKIHYNCFQIIHYMLGEISDFKELKKLLFLF